MKAKLIRCLAPLPETSSNPVLTRMLEIAPYQAPSGEDRGGNKEASAATEEVIRGGGTETSSPQGRKRTAFEDPKTMVSKRGKKSSPKGPSLWDTPAALCPQGDQPSTEAFILQFGS